MSSGRDNISSGKRKQSLGVLLSFTVSLKLLLKATWLFRCTVLMAYTLALIFRTETNQRSQISISMMCLLMLTLPLNCLSFTQ